MTVAEVDHNPGKAERSRIIILILQRRKKKEKKVKKQRKKEVRNKESK